MTVFLIVAAVTGWSGLLVAVFQMLCMTDQVNELATERDTARRLASERGRELVAADLAIGYLESRLAGALPSPKEPAGRDLTAAQREQLRRAAR